MKNITQLKQWLLNKPVIFSLMCFGIITIVGIIYSVIQAFLKFETLLPMYLIFAGSFIYSIYYMIKKLPHDEMPQKDFIAITNGASIISITSSIIAMITLGIIGHGIKMKMMMMYLLHPTMFLLLLLSVALITLYIVGVAISGIYAKYKRITTMGVSPWKAILSMPFAFLMLWTPGYLIAEKGNKKSNLLIKSKWYNRFNKWVASNFTNTLTTFLFLLFCKSMLTSSDMMIPTSLILTIALLIIYTLWYVKHKSDFVKNINKGYALTAVGINLIILIIVILTLG